MKVEGWSDIITSIKTPISLLALITLIVGSLLHFNHDQDLAVTRGAIALLFIIALACIIFVTKNRASFPSEIRSIWSNDDLPLSEEERDAWLGKWNGRWTYQTKAGELAPYVDDIIEITEISCQSGELVGVGYSSYAEGKTYCFKGRVSSKRVAHLFFTSPAETSGLSGMVVLRRSPIGDISGWWLGVGRHGGDIGGGVEMERHEKNPEFKVVNYDVE